MLSAPFYERDGQIAIDMPGAHALFTTRSWGDVRWQRAQIEQTLGLSTRFSKQVHGARVVRADELPATPNGDLELTADALLTATPDIAATILTADCLPIAISVCDRDGGPGVVAAVHAGWRGLDSGVIGSSVEHLRALKPQGRLSAAIGPGAGACCYEVGPELHERFAGFSAGANLDLKAVARHQLERAGVVAIHDCEQCTICGTEYALYSYRREGAQAGRQGLIAWLS